MRGSAVENPTNQSFRNPSLIQVMSCKGSVSYFCVILEISANANDVSATPGINELMLYSSGALQYQKITTLFNTIQANNKNVINR